MASKFLLCVKKLSAWFYNTSYKIKILYFSTEIYSTDLMQRRTRGWGIRWYQIESDDLRVNVLSLVSVGWVFLAYSLFAAQVQSG